MLTARDIMTRDVATIGPEASLQDALQLIISREISGLPVVDRDRRLVGIITEFAMLATAYDPTVACDVVSQHMTTDVLTVDADDPVRKIADLFVVHRVRRVPVTEHGRMAGLITRRDVLKAVFETEPQVCARRPISS
jgi:CBS domain-containing protein